jgi:hypothetical protein
VSESLLLLDRELTVTSSPALATALAWLVRRWASAYALYDGVVPAWIAAFGEQGGGAERLVSGALVATSVWIIRWPLEPRLAGASARLLGCLARARGARLAPLIAQSSATQQLLRATACSLSSSKEDDDLTRAIRRLGLEDRAELACSLADATLGGEAWNTALCFFETALAATLEAHMALALQGCCSSMSTASERNLALALALYAGIARSGEFVNQQGCFNVSEGESHWPIVFLSLLRHIGEKYWC